MILYKLICENEHEFEGWFQSSAAYDKLAEKKQVDCPDCGTTKVAKAIMAPNVATKGALTRKKDLSPEQKAQAYMAYMAAQVREHVEKNFDNVGKEFPDEARRIYYGETEERGIYGEASVEDVKELVEEGIDVCPIPDPPKLQ